MLLNVSDPRSNPNDQIAHAAESLRRSTRRKAVFEAIYRDKRKAKTVSQLAKATGLTRVAVLQEGGKRAGLHIVNQTKIDGETAYEKDRFYATNKKRILRLSANPIKLKAFPTKYGPKVNVSAGRIQFKVSGARVQVTQMTCDDIDEFQRVRKIRGAPRPVISEKSFKAGVQRLLGERGKFQDWGGERNDLYTSKVRYKGKRYSVAFAFKGPGTKGVLTPGKLGKHGNQIQRLFLSPADIFIIQYHGQIDQDVLEQMHAFAALNSVREAKRIRYGVIDGDDSARLIAAYPKQFSVKS